MVVQRINHQLGMQVITGSADKKKRKVVPSRDRRMFEGQFRY